MVDSLSLALKMAVLLLVPSLSVPPDCILLVVMDSTMPAPSMASQLARVPLCMRNRDLRTAVAIWRSVSDPGPRAWRTGIAGILPFYGCGRISGQE